MCTFRLLLGFLFFHLSRILKFIIHTSSLFADDRFPISLARLSSLLTAIICIAVLESFPAKVIRSLSVSAGTLRNQINLGIYVRKALE